MGVLKPHLFLPSSRTQVKRLQHPFPYPQPCSLSGEAEETYTQQLPHAIKEAALLPGGKVAEDKPRLGKKPAGRGRADM